jgi:dihydroorotase-like cyclic amidohydrolase
MIEILNAQTPDGHRVRHFVESPESKVIDATDLMLFPAVIDPQARIPHDEREARSFILGGVTTLMGPPSLKMTVKNLPIRFFPYPNDLIIQSGEASLREAIERAARREIPLYVQRVRSSQTLELIRRAKREGHLVFAEAALEDLMAEFSQSLWEAVGDETIDTVGTGGSRTLNSLLNAYRQGKITLEAIVSVTHTRPQEIFELPPIEDVVLVGPKGAKYTIAQGKLFSHEEP